MADVRFEIDKVRSNSFYHYTKYSGNQIVLNAKGNPDIGWGLYSHLYDNADKSAWIIAVNQYNKEHNIITPSEKIKTGIEEFKRKFEIEEKKYPQKQSYILPALQSAISFVTNTEDCDDDYLEKLQQSTGGVLPTKKAIAKYALEAAANNIEIDYHILMDSYMKLGVTAFIYPVCDAINSFIDIFFMGIDAIYDEYSKLAADPIYMFRKWTSDITISNDEKQRYKDLFDASIKQFSPAAREIIVKILSIDILKITVDFLQSVKTLSTNIWKSIINRFNAIKDIISTIEFTNKDKFISALNTILYALGGLIGGVVAANCMKTKEIDTAIESLCQTDNVSSEEELIDKMNNEIIDYQNNMYDNTIIYKYAANNKNGYSLYKTSESSSYLDIEDPNVNELIELCKVSMCDDISSTDTSDWYNQFDTSEYIIIEFNINYNFTILLAENQNININDIIAYIDGVPVKSRKSFIVVETGQNYIIGRYTVNADNMLSEIFTTDDSDNISNTIQNYITNSINTFTNNDYDRIIKKFQQHIYVKDFIRDYLSFYRFAELAQYTREYSNADATAVSTDKFIEIYESQAQEILDSYYNDVKNTCKKKNIKKYINRGKVATLKSILDNKSDNCIDKILKLYYDNPGNLKYCSKGRICDYMLYSHYIEFLFSDKFEYDEDNPYIKTLSDTLNDFITVRSRLELNKDNLSALIQSFNELCDTTISIYWTYTDIDYYTKLCELFKYNTYTNTDIIIEGTEFDSISLYKRVLQYLKSITKFTRAEDYNTEINLTTDFNKLLEEQDKLEDKKVNKDEIRFEKDLKKIAYRFFAIRKIEQSLSNINISDYIDNSVLQQFNELYQQIGDTAYEYYDGIQQVQTTASVVDNAAEIMTNTLYSAKSILGPYIQMLKQVTAAEVKTLRNLFLSVTNIYNENKDSINSCEDLFKLGEINWPGESIIYKDNVQCDYFLFNNIETCPKNMDDLFELEKEIENEETPADELLSMSISPKTQYGIDSIKYWLKYCGIATAVNAMMPIYWSTGINLMGTPVPLPIIYMPIIPITIGSIVIIIGIGICGICPLPMILFINTGTDNGSTIIPINLLIDQVKSLIPVIKSVQKPAIKDLTDTMIKKLDNDINSYKKKISDINFQIDEIKKIEIDYKTKRLLQQIKNQDRTSMSTE